MYTVHVMLLNTAGLNDSHVSSYTSDYRPPQTMSLQMLIVLMSESTLAGVLVVGICCLLGIVTYHNCTEF